MGVGILIAGVVSVTIGTVGWLRRKQKQKRVLKKLAVRASAESSWKKAFPCNEAEWRWLLAQAMKECNLSEEFLQNISPDIPWARTMICEWGGGNLELISFTQAIEKHFCIELKLAGECETFGELFERILKLCKRC